MDLRHPSFHTGQGIPVLYQMALNMLIFSSVKTLCCLPWTSFELQSLLVVHLLH